MELSGLARIAPLKKAYHIGDIQNFDGAVSEDFLTAAGTSVPNLGVSLVDYGAIFNATAGSTATGTMIAATQAYQSCFNKYLVPILADGDKNCLVRLTDIFPDLIESLGEMIYCPYPSAIEF